MSEDWLRQYRLDELLSSTPSALVWRAYDTVLNRPVAIKILTDAPAAQSNSLHEAQSLAKLNDPNIVTLYEIFQDNNQTYLVMEYIEGKTLGDFYGGSQPTLTYALAFATTLASALEAAHKAGILHSDIKPANIMVDKDGNPKLLDFGIAKHGLAAESLPTLTSDEPLPTRIKGTLPYMAPELFTGTQPDIRTDIFSLGTVFWEFFAGRRAFHAPTEVAILNSIVNDTPTDLASLRPDLPPDITALVTSMMAKNRDLRPRSMTEVRTLLQKSARPNDKRSAKENRPKKRYLIAAAAIVIVVFIPLGGVPSFYGSEASISGLIDKGVHDLREFQKEGAIDAATDSFQSVLVRDPDNAAATAGLSLALINHYLVEDTNPATLAQARAAAKLALNLDEHLALSHTAMAWILERDGEEDKATIKYQRALQLDPSDFFALKGYARLLTNTRLYSEARKTLETAISLYPETSDFYDNLGEVYFNTQDYDRAEAMFQTSAHLSPDNIFAYSSLSAVQYMRDDIHGAIASVQRGLKIRPHATLYSNLGTYFFALGQYSQAVNAFEKAVAVKGNSDDYRLWANLADSYRWTSGYEQQATAAYNKALDIISSQYSEGSLRPDLHSRRALYYAKAGQKDNAQNALSNALKLAPNDASLLYRAAITSELLGRREQALNYLSQALEKGYPITAIQREPELTDLRRDRVFGQILLTEQN